MHSGLMGLSHPQLNRQHNWRPIIYQTSTLINTTTKYAKWWRNGSLVTASCEVLCNSAGPGAGFIYLTGLPVPIHALNSKYSMPIPMSIGSALIADISTRIYSATALAADEKTILFVFDSFGGANWYIANVSASDSTYRTWTVASGDIISATVSYEVRSFRGIR